MNKIYIIIAGAFLVLLIIVSILLSLGKKSTTNTQKDSPFPTSVPSQESSKQLPNESNLSNGSNVSNESNSPSLDISTISPVETVDFKMQYSYKQRKIIVEKKTPQAEEQFLNWANQNNLSQLIEDPDLFMVVNLGKNPDDFNPVIEFLNIFMNMGQGINLSTQSSSSSTDSSSTSSTTDSKKKSSSTASSSSPSTKFTYYAQCGDLGKLSLPDGCNLCEAGCGPTAVSMIASSYLGKDYDPKAIVNLYKSKSYLLGCGGSRYTDAHEILKGLGLKTTDYIMFNSEKSDTVVPQLKKYLAGGWTFFALANFCDNGCGHYFWITDINSEGDIIAYDPAYGRYQIPYNENDRYPFPLYRLAFGVKK